MAVRLLLVVILSCLCVHCQAKQCVRFQDGHPLSGCAAAGYNYTYPLPDDLSSITTSAINRFVKFFTNAVKNCSVVQTMETVACMSYAPKCVDASKDPVLPCRRVCSEAMKRCYSSINLWVAEWIMRMCYILPNATAKSGKCYEPEGFDKLYNASTTGPLEESKCQNLINFPFCVNMGYNHTVLSPKRQAMAYRFFYGKNVTEPNPSTPAPKSIMTRVFATIKGSPKCANDIKQLLCSEVIPPCFLDEGPNFYTVCKPICKSISEKCPEVLKGRNRYYYGECERMAPGKTSHGYCKHTKFPPMTDWGKYFYPKKPTKTPPKGVSTTLIIVIAVVVPVVITISIVAAVFLMKKRKEKQMFDYQRHE